MTEQMESLRYRSTDNGNCRVYYTWKSPAGNKRLFCFQEDGHGKFKVFLCSRDGEPSYDVELRGRTIDGLPADDSVTSRNFRAWWKARY